MNGYQIGIAVEPAADFGGDIDVTVTIDEIAEDQHRTEIAASEIRVPRNIGLGDAVAEHVAAKIRELLPN